jgi:hypothetical protein
MIPGRILACAYRNPNDYDDADIRRSLRFAPLVKHELSITLSTPAAYDITCLFYWRPVGDSNPCCRRERAVSWAGLDERDGGSVEDQR